MRDLVYVRVYPYKNILEVDKHFLKVFIGKERGKKYKLMHINFYASGLSLRYNKIEDDDWNRILEQIFCMEYLK